MRSLHSRSSRRGPAHVIVIPHSGHVRTRPLVGRLFTSASLRGDFHIGLGVVNLSLHPRIGNLIDVLGR